MDSLRPPVMHILSWLYSARHPKRMLMLMQNAELGIQSSNVCFKFGLWMSRPSRLLTELLFVYLIIYFFQKIGRNVTQEFIEIVFFLVGSPANTTDLKYTSK